MFVTEFKESMQPSSRRFQSDLSGDADFTFSSRTSHLLYTSNNWPADYGIVVLDWLANFSDLNPIENLWDMDRRKTKDTRQTPNDAGEPKATVKATRASVTPQQCHRLITSYAEHVFTVNISVLEIIFRLSLCNTVMF